MRSRIFRTCVILATAVPAFAAPKECDRACLKSTLDQYLNAVIQHDPAAAPLFVGFRQTENAVVVRPGTGVWKTVTALGKLQRRYLDPVSGQAGYFGTVEEQGEPAIVTVRLKVEDRKITEAEWFLVHKGDPGLNGPPAPGQNAGNFFDPDNVTAHPPPDRIVPKDSRTSREALIAITNSYFDGITTHDGSLIMAHPGCTRVENGNTVTGRPAGGRGRGPAPEAAAAPGAVTDCTSGLATINIQNVAARRYPIVDEEAGVVLAIAVFLRKPGTPTRRNAFSEWFVIDNSKIRSIYSAMFYPPPEAPVPNWPPYEGNWPLPPTLAAPPAAPNR
ncbi:MAG: hypothetical protein LAP40_08900 [Acidobacteriia bacterium]|nr:hypothetical protein [Terriglobia bacterium]